MSSVRNKGIKCEECNKQERNWGKIKEKEKKKDLETSVRKNNKSIRYNPATFPEKSCRDSDSRLIFLFVNQSS